LRLWAAGGVRVFTFSSGSIPAQRMIFGHSTEGDLSGLLAGFFDTRIGAKREPDTYVRLAIAMNVPTAKAAFLSDVEAELDAAAAAGMRTCQIHRADAGGARAERHPVAADFGAAAALLGLPTS
jgi:enolase-phosphatase E1